MTRFGKPDQLETAGPVPDAMIRTQADEDAVRRGCLYSEATVDWVCATIRANCRHVAGEWYGKPFEISDWQREEIIAPVYGWIQPDGSRRFRWAYIEAPKKTPGKSTLCAGLSVVALREEPGALVYIIAGTREQSGSTVYGTLEKMVRQAQERPNGELWHIRKTVKEIDFGPTGSMAKAMPQKEFSGPQPNFVVMDEIHEWKNADCFNTMRYAGRGRRQPLFFIITNAGADTESLWWNLREKAKSIIDGESKEDRWYCRLMGADVEDAEREVEAVAAGATEIPVALSVNPHVGTPEEGGICTEAELLADIRDSAKTPWERDNCLRFNYAAPKKTAAADWLRPYWDGCLEEFEEGDFHGEICSIGFDRGSSMDPSSAVFLFERDGHYYQLPYFWIPKNRIRELARQFPNFDAWVRDGFIYQMPGKVFDEAFFRNTFAEVANKFDATEITYDPNKAEICTQWMPDSLGIDRIQFAQSHANYNQYVVRWEEMVIAKRIHHNGHPMFAWQAANAVRGVNIRGHIMPQKIHDKSPKSVDSIQAACMASATMILDTDDYFESDDMEELGVV